MSANYASKGPMILFINFAPISFGGGVERWIASMSDTLLEDEKVSIIQVDRSISDYYAQLTLRRKFNARVKLLSEKVRLTSMKWGSFLPRGESWKELHSLIHDARVVYMKLEVNELLILLYFGGFSVLRKTVIGLHSPFQYSHPRLSLIERLHNVVYSSSIIGAVLRRAKKVHILSFEQEKNVRLNHDLKNLVVIPNFVDNSPVFHSATSDNRLHIAFVGELTPRKGADVLLKVIDQAPSSNLFDIIGDGPLKGAFLEKKRENMTYHGYLPQRKIAQILSRSDALLMPSQAESFSLVSLEALSHGLSVICSPNISPSILDLYLEINRTGTVDDYLTNVDRLGQEKLSGKLAAKRKQIWKEINERFSKKSILKRLKKEVFA